MMSQLYNVGGICYNNYAEANKSRGLFFLPEHLNIAIIVNSAATLESPNLFASAAADKAKTRLRLFFVQNSSLKANDTAYGWSPNGVVAKGISMLFLQEALYPNALRFVNTRIPKFIPTIPNEESPGNFLASDSIFSLLSRRDELGLSTLFPLIAAPIVASLLPGAALPGGAA